MLRKHEQVHKIERRYALSKGNCWAASKASLRAKLADKLQLPYLDKKILAERKLQSKRLALKTKSGLKEETLRNTAKVSPRNMGASSQMFKHSTEQQRGKAITSYMGTELEVLDVSSLSWTRDTLALVGKCKNLIRCNMSCIDVTDSAVIALKSCRRLRHFNISQSKVSARTLAESVPSWRHLQTLIISNNPQFFDFPNHGSDFLRSKWKDKYEGVGKRALKNYYSFLHRLRMISTCDIKTLKKIQSKNDMKDNRLEIAMVKGMMNGNVRYLFGQLAVHGDNIVTQNEIRGLSKMVGLTDTGVENIFPMPFDSFALRIVLCLKAGIEGVSWNEFVQLAWKTVGVTVVANENEDGIKNNKVTNGDRKSVV